MYVVWSEIRTGTYVFQISAVPVIGRRTWRKNREEYRVILLEGREKREIVERDCIFCYEYSCVYPLQ